MVVKYDAETNSVGNQMFDGFILTMVLLVQFPVIPAAERDRSQGGRWFHVHPGQ